MLLLLHDTYAKLLQYENNFFKPRNGAGIGSPISCLLAEIYLLTRRT
jgi:hypothetical protein